MNIADAVQLCSWRLRLSTVL